MTMYKLTIVAFSGRQSLYEGFFIKKIKIKLDLLFFLVGVVSYFQLTQYKSILRMIKGFSIIVK